MDLHKNACAAPVGSGLIETCRHLFLSCRAVSTFLDVSALMVNALFYSLWREFILFTRCCAADAGGVLQTEAAFPAFWNLSSGPEKKGNSNDEKWQMSVEVDGELHGSVLWEGRGPSASSPCFQGGVGLGISTAMTREEVWDWRWSPLSQAPQKHPGWKRPSRSPSPATRSLPAIGFHVAARRTQQNLFTSCLFPIWMAWEKKQKKKKKQRKLFWVDHRHRSVNSKRAHHVLGSRDFEQGAGDWILEKRMATRILVWSFWQRERN